jgi:hypothetical protein
MTTSKLQSAAVALLTVVGIGGVGAATVWACGGYGGPRLALPVSANKPFPFESVETRDAQPTGAAWARPVPAGTANAGTDKPAGADAGGAKDARFVLTNPARDITVVSDRHETFVEFFRRQPVMVATVSDDLRDKLLVGAKAPLDYVFVDKASFNDGGPRAAAYGASVKLAPVAFDGPVYHLLELTASTEPVVFVRDAGDTHLWHAVGFTRRSSVGFFATTQRVKPDEFAPTDLIQAIEKK